MDRLVNVTDYDCVANLRMDRNTFGRLSRVLSSRTGVVTGKCVGVEEQVGMSVLVLAHHQKNRVVKFQFWRSGSTVFHYVNKVLGAVLSLHDILLSKPEAVPVGCLDNGWKWFKVCLVTEFILLNGCLGALDGTHINVLVSSTDKPRYRMRKGQIATNTLPVCDRDMQFVFVLPGWEGSAGDSRVLRDAVTQQGGLRVPQGCYYLCDNGYANSNGFLTPYKGVRYHLKEWGPGNAAPQNPKELSNMRHTKARNIIERAFAVLKMRWGILRCASYYPIKTQIRLTMACFLLHNFIRREMSVDPIEAQIESNVEYTTNIHDVDGADFVDHVEP
ncbi:uncharacterized protein LOC121760450 [Salvia splendens]|uniref:uncharacterized protein LOC121760450 n=1 Tax=Salvia splendens TaxID=180675 RepID=UPI001C258D58|nr:uncharacterized protein LOC121760450 [Salvia splendens]